MCVELLNLRSSNFNFWFPTIMKEIMLVSLIKIMFLVMLERRITVWQRSLSMSWCTPFLTAYCVFYVRWKKGGCFTAYAAAQGVKGDKRKNSVTINRWKWIKKKLKKVPIKVQSMDLDFQEMR